MANSVPQQNPRVISEEVELTWNVPNFLELRKDTDNINKQQLVFELGQHIGLSSKWQCFMQYQKKDNQNWIGLFLNAFTLPSNVDKIQTTCKFKVPYKSEKKYDYPTYKFDQEFNTTLAWGYHQVISQDRKLKDLVLKENGDLEIKVVVTVKKPVDLPSTALSDLSPHLNTFTSRLCSDLDKMYSKHLNMNNKVTKIRSKDGKEFPVYPAILAARNPVFEELFLQNKQGQNGVIEDSDISSEPLNVLLNFMHAGKLEECWKNENVIEELVYGTYKYEQEDLLDYLDQALGNVCTNNNCWKLITLARRYELKTAEERLMEYFRLNLTENLEVIQFAKDAEITETIRDRLQTGAKTNSINEQENLLQWCFVKAMKFGKRLYNRYRVNK